jgi:hypothetical protein
MRDLRAGISVFLMLAAAACAASNTSSEAAGPAPAGGADSARASTSIPVVIDNQNISDMNIYLAKGGSRVLLGSAGGLSKTTLTIPGSLTPADSRVKLLADPVGGSASIPTPSLIVPPGQRLYWTIGSDPSMSTTSTGE